MLKKIDKVLVISWILAIISAFFVHPGKEYISYIDFRSLGILWGLMVIIQGFKENSVLQYWVLENVPSVKKHIKDQYTAQDLGLLGNFILYPKGGASGVYNAKYYGAPTNRKRYLCGEFPAPEKTKDDKTVVTLGDVLAALGDPLAEGTDVVSDVNYPNLHLPRNRITDHHYVYEMAAFEIETARRLKQDKGYMGRMSFPERLDKPSRTVMATMSACSREAMVLKYGAKYRLPTVREAASMMSFPIDYQFYGQSRGIKHTLVGNAVPPKMAFAIAKAITLEAGEALPQQYIPIHHDEEIQLYNLNGVEFPPKEEKPRRDVAKFKYHIPYLIYSAYRVELTNYESNFELKSFCWNAEIHYSQGKKKAAKYRPTIKTSKIPVEYRKQISKYISETKKRLPSFNEFQRAYCMTENQRKMQNAWGPYELLADIKKFIVKVLPDDNRGKMIDSCDSLNLPLAILVGYYILDRLVKYMGGKSNGCSNKKG